MNERNLQVSILKTVRRLLAEGTVGTNVATLLRATPVPADAPKGTNAAYVYHYAFTGVLANTKLPGGFGILPD